jgi:hypothetical protein
VASASTRAANIDAIAIDIALIDDDVTDVDADAEFDPAIFGHVRVVLDHGPLDFHGATNCINRTRKFDQNAVAHGFEDTPPMFRQAWINQFAATGLEGGERTLLVPAHETAVAGDVGRQNGYQPPFDSHVGHKNSRLFLRQVITPRTRRSGNFGCYGSGDTIDKVSKCSRVPTSGFGGQARCVICIAPKGVLAPNELVRSANSVAWNAPIFVRVVDKVGIEIARIA